MKKKFYCIENEEEFYILTAIKNNKFALINGNFYIPNPQMEKFDKSEQLNKMINDGKLKISSNSPVKITMTNGIHFEITIESLLKSFENPKTPTPEELVMFKLEHGVNSHFLQNLDNFPID